MKLIFCDTFHQEPPDGSVTSSWAIIEFPCAVVLEEIRIVPRGARVHDQLAGDTQRGQTNPPHFRIDFFACDVKNENASTFENLCAIEYHESSKTSALPRLPFLTKQLLCSGWYSSVTIAVFGAEGSDSASVKAIHERRDNLTRLSSRPPPTAPLVDDMRTAFQNMDSREFSRTAPLLPLPNILPQPGPVGDIPVNQSAGYQSFRQDGNDRRPIHSHNFQNLSYRERSSDNFMFRSETVEDEIYRNQVSLLHNSGNSSSFPQRGLHHDHPNYRYQRGNSRYADQDNYNNRRRFQGMNRAAQTEKHDADPTVEEEAKFVQDDAEHENQMQMEDDWIGAEYEEISDDEMDEEANLRDMEAMMTADMLLPTSVMSFNPFDMEVFPLSHFRSPDLSDFEVIRNKLSQQSYVDDEELEQTTILHSKSCENLRKLVDSTLRVCPIEFNGKHTAEICAGNEDQWVNNLEKITLALSNELPYLEMCNENQVDYNVMLITWALYAMELNGPLSKHISLSVRALKVGLGMVKALSQTCSEIVEQLDKSNVFEAIFCMLLEKHVASSLKILALHTLDAVTNWPAMIDSFLFKPFSIAIKDENSLKLQTGYAWLIEIALEPQAARVVAGVTQLTKKVHLYECMHQVQVITQSVVNEKIPDEFAYISEEEEEYSNEEEVQEVEMVVMSSASADEEEEQQDEKRDSSRILNEHTKVDLGLRIVHEKGERKVIGLSQNSEIYDSVAEDNDAVESLDGQNNAKIESHLTPVESVIYMDDVTVNEEDLLKIAACLDEITACFQNPQQFFGRLSVLTFPLSRRQRPTTEQTNDKFAEQPAYRMAEGTNLLASIQALVSLPIVSGHKALFDSCGRFLESLISSHPGLLYLASNSDSTLHIIQHLMKSSLQLEVEDMNSPCNLGARLAFHLQTIQSLDLVSTLLESDADEEDIEEELAHAFKTLYSITYLPIGRQCVSRVLSKDDNLKSIITCLTYPNKIAEEEETQEVNDKESNTTKNEEKHEKIETSDKEADDKDEKKPAVFHHRTAVNCYAGSLLLSLLQGSEDMAYIYRHQSDLTITCLAKRQLISHAEDIQNWLTPLQEQLTGDVTDIEKLVSFIKLRTSLLEWITFPESGPELCMTLRLLCYICLIDTDKDLKDDAESRVRVLSLFASDALNVLLSFMDQLQKCLQFACHGHRAMASGMTLTSHQMITSMTCRSYSLLQRMLSHLVGADIDSKIVNGERITLTVISLYSDLHLLLYPSDPNLLDTITEQAISIISIFFSPSSCSEKFLSTEMQYKVLKQVTTFAESQCDNFLPTLTLLSQLLPLPLPIIVPEDPPQQAQAIVVATCRLWSSTIPSHVDDIMALLLPLSSSTCRPLVELTIIIVQQLADLSSTLANSLVKKYIEEMIPLSVSAVLAEQEGSEVPQEENGEKEMLLSPEQITVIQTFAEIISLPAAKTAFLCACHSEPQGVLDLWQYATNEESPADAVAAILLLAYVLVDEETSLLPFDYTLQSYANALPAVDQIEAIVTLALSQLLNISPRVYNRALLVLCNLTSSSIGFPYVVKHILAKSDNLRKAINGICDGFDVNQPKSVDAVFHLLQFVHSLLTPQLDNGPNRKFTLAQFKSLISSDEKTVVQAFVNLENKLGELICEEQNFSAQYALALDQYSSLRQSLCIVDISTTETQVPEFASLPEPTPLNEQFIGRPMFAYGNHDAILATRQALTAPPSQQLNLDNQDDYRVVECDLIATAENFCPGYDLAEQVNKLAKSSGLQDEVEESEAAAAARAKRRQKVEAFSARFGKTMNFIKRSHGLLVTQRPGRGRGRGNPSNRPYDLFRHRKQNTSRPPSMHVDDFLAADEQQQQIEENTYFKPPAPLPLTTAPRRTSQPSFKREFMPRGRGSRGGSSRNGSTTSRGSFSRFGSTNCLQGKIKSKSPSSSGNGRISRIPDRFRGPDNTTRITSRLSFSPREGYKTNKTQNPPWGISRNFSPGSASFRGRGSKYSHRGFRNTSSTQFQSPGPGKPWGLVSRRGRGFMKTRGRGKHSRSITH